MYCISWLPCVSTLFWFHLFLTVSSLRPIPQEQISSILFLWNSPIPFNFAPGWHFNQSSIDLWFSQGTDICLWYDVFLIPVSHVPIHLIALQNKRRLWKKDNYHRSSSSPEALRMAWALNMWYSVIMMRKGQFACFKEVLIWKENLGKNDSLEMWL